MNLAIILIILFIIIFIAILGAVFYIKRHTVKPKSPQNLTIKWINK